MERRKWVNKWGKRGRWQSPPSKFPSFPPIKQPCGKVKIACFACKGIGKHPTLLNKRDRPLSCPSCMGQGQLTVACACRSCKAIGRALKQAIRTPDITGMTASAKDWINSQKPVEVKGFMRPKGLPEHVLIRRRLQYSLPKW